MLGSMLESIFRAYISTYMAVSIPSCSIRSVVEIILNSEIENIVGGISGNILGV
jgi:hypothetical protein